MVFHTIYGGIRMIVKWIGLFCCISVILSCATTQTDIEPVVEMPKAEVTVQSELLPIDSAVRSGKLANGLRYLIRENKRPENRAELRLVVNAGSILENDDQQGLAHFVEHNSWHHGPALLKRHKLLGISSHNTLRLVEV